MWTSRRRSSRCCPLWCFLNRRHNRLHYHRLRHRHRRHLQLFLSVVQMSVGLALSGTLSLANVASHVKLLGTRRREGTWLVIHNRRHSFLGSRRSSEACERRRPLIASLFCRGRSYESQSVPCCFQLSSPSTGDVLYARNFSSNSTISTSHYTSRMRTRGCVELLRQS